MWIDSHCHVTADRYDEDRAAVLERAADARVTALVAIGAGYGIDGNAEAVALAESDPPCSRPSGCTRTTPRSSPPTS